MSELERYERELEARRREAAKLGGEPPARLSARRDRRQLSLLGAGHELELGRPADKRNQSQASLFDAIPEGE